MRLLELILSRNARSSWTRSRLTYRLLFSIVAIERATPRRQLY